MANPLPLQHDAIYHIYNRGNNREDLFFERRNYRHFLRLYLRHVHPVVETYAYCLLRNHFHLLIKTKSEDQVSRAPSQCFANLFNAYAKAINKTYDRTGALFERPFRRIAVREEAHLIGLVMYIHLNPVWHGFVEDAGDWPWSSYGALEGIRPTRLRRDVVLDWFGGRDEFVRAHEAGVEDADLSGLQDLTGL